MTTNADQVARLVQEIREFCVSKADAELAAKYTRFFKEGYDPYGLSSETLHAFRDEWVGRYAKELALDGVLDVGDGLFTSGKYEEGSLAILFAIHFRDQLDGPTFQRIGKWLETGVRNWAHSDTICGGELIGHCLKRGTVALDDFSTWRTSEGKFKRRAVPVSMLALLGTSQDLGVMLEFIRPMMLDDERVVHQGLGWFLREAWKQDREVVEPFLLEWKDSAARLIYQYATEKMTAEGKARFRRSKAK